MAISVTGAAEIAAIAAACRSLGSDRTIVNDMAKEIRKGILPIRKEIRARAVEILPHRGGLGAWVAKARITATVLRAPLSAGVKIKGGRNSGGIRATKIRVLGQEVSVRGSRGRRSDLKAIDAGRVRHPTWGHKPWTAQAVTPGFFTDPVSQEGQRYLEQAVLVAAEHAAERIIHA